MSWYYCSGCGPSVKCDVCGATECAQALKDDCPGCAKARELSKGPVPWNMWILGKGVRGWKHLRKRETRIRQHRHKLRRSGAYGNANRWIRCQGRWVRNPHSLDSLFS